MADPVYNNVKEDEPVNVGVPQVATGGTIIAPTGVPFKGNASVVPSKFSQSGINQVAIGVGKDIQDAINAMHAAGGGKVFLGAGTHIVTTPLVGYTGVDIEGENQSTTIIDFKSTSANLSFAGTDVYAVGTITSITSGVNVTGSGTSWLANVTTDHQLFIGNTWYKIAAVTGDTTLILSEGYQGNATLPGAAYRASKIQRDVDIKDVTLKSSTGTALVATDCRNFSLKNVKFDSNNKGFVFTNVSEIIGDNGLLSVSNTSNGAELTNARLCNFYNLATPGNGGHGFVLNNVETGVVMESSSNSNTSDGYNLTSCSNLVMSPVEASSNGGQGVELVSGNDNININGTMNANTSDGIKLSATTDNCRIIGCKITNNDGYALNIAASSCDNNIISSNTFSLAYILLKSPLMVAATPSLLHTGTSIATLDITGNITIECWVKFTSMPADRADLISKPNAAKSSYATYHLELEKNGVNYDLRMLVDVGGTLQVVDKLSWNPSTGVWYHIAATRDSATGVQKIIIDGIEAASATNTAGAAVSSTSALTIGNFAPDTTNLPHDGRASLVRVWNVVRTPTQINDNKCVVYGTATTNMQAEWSLDNVLTDASGNGSTLTNVGSVLFATDLPSVCPINLNNSGTGTVIRGNVGISDN